MLTFDHFKHLFTDRNFGTAITNSLKTTIGSLILSLAVGICAAYVLARRRFRFGLKKPVTYWILLVRVLPPVAFTIPLYTMFSKVGILNTRLPVMLACVLINVPLIIWFLISFFQDLPEEIEESAKVDGATEWQLFRKIKLPLISSTVTINVILAVISGLKAFDYSFIMTNGGPGKSTKTLMFQVYETAFNDMKMGRASAFSVLAFAFIIVITVIMLLYMNKREVEL